MVIVNCTYALHTLICSIGADRNRRKCTCFPTRPVFFRSGKKQNGREKGGDETKQPKTGALKLGIYYGSPRVSLLTLAHKHTEMCSGARILYKSPFSASNVLWMAAKMGLGEFHSPRSLWARHLWPDHDMSPLAFFFSLLLSSGVVIGSWKK